MQAFRRWSRSAAWIAARAISSTDVVVAVDRGFRYLQMLITATLLTALTRAVASADVASTAQVVLCSGAGLYLAVPLSRWMFAVLPAPPERDDPRHSARLRVAIGLSAVNLTVFSLLYSNLAIGLFSAQLHIDTRSARSTYRVWSLNAAEDNCIQPGQSWEMAEKCLKRVDERFGIAVPGVHASQNARPPSPPTNVDANDL